MFYSDRIPFITLRSSGVLYISTGRKMSQIQYSEKYYDDSYEYRSDQFLVRLLRLGFKIRVWRPNSIKKTFMKILSHRICFYVQARDASRWCCATSSKGPAFGRGKLRIILLVVARSILMTLFFLQCSVRHIHLLGISLAFHVMGRKQKIL